MLFANCLAFVLITLSAAFDERMCSKFHYEEQLLTKVIKMEIEMAKLRSDMQTTMKTSNENTVNEIEKIKSDIETNIKPSIENLKTLTAMNPQTMVAFSAYNPTQTEYGDGPIIVFKNVLLNEGSSYDTSTGIFTANVKGLYHFTAHVCNRSGNYAVVAIVHGGSKVAISTQYENDGSSCGSVSSLIKVGVGEQVNVISAYTATKMSEDQYRRASFMGVLVHP